MPAETLPGTDRILADDFLCSNPGRRGGRWLAVSAHVTRG